MSDTYRAWGVYGPDDELRRTEPGPGFVLATLAADEYVRVVHLPSSSSPVPKENTDAPK